MADARVKLLSMTSIFLATLLAASPVLLAQNESAVRPDGPDGPDGDDKKVEKRVERYVWIGDDDEGSHEYRFFEGLHGRGFLGVQLMSLTPELRVHFGLSEDVGVMVAKVEANSPAEQAGVQVGDILTELDGETVDSSRKLARYVRRKEEGDTVSLGLWRDGGAQTVFVTIAERQRNVMRLGGPGSPLHGIKVLDGPHEKFSFAWDGENFSIDEDIAEALGHAMQGLEEHFDSEEWQERLERIKSMDWSGVQKRMEELESRLKALERELEQEEQKKENDSKDL